MHGIWKEQGAPRRRGGERAKPPPAPIDLIAPISGFQPRLIAVWKFGPDREPISSEPRKSNDARDPVRLDALASLRVSSYWAGEQAPKTTDSYGQSARTRSRADTSRP